MNSNKPINRNTASIIAKCLIVFIVLGIVCSLSIWAWLTKGSSATADGISVKSKGDGVQVSWDGKNYYDNLQALKSEDVSAPGGASGPALNISGVEGQAAPLKLVTGNGLQFFEPSLNRRLGTVLKYSDGSWYGKDITSDNSKGKYIDIDLYFRSDVERDVYLAGDSAVLPKSTTDRISEYGAFSKDWIAAASRIAFLDSTKEKCSFIWAPNLNCRLESNESGYQKYTTTNEEEITISGGSDGVLDGGAVDDGKTYYLWTFKNELIDTYAKGQNSNYLEARTFRYDASIRYFVTEVSFYIPTYEQNNPSIPVMINNSNNVSDLVSSDSVNIKGYQSLQNAHVDQHFYVSDGEWNLDNSTIKCTNKLYSDTRYIKSGEAITIKFGYNPDTDILTVLNYEASGGQKFTLGGEEVETTVTVKYFPLGDSVNCALVNPSSSTAVSSGTNYKNSVIFTDSNKNNVSPVSTTLTEQFTTVKNTKNGTGYYATFKFKNNSANTYLTLTNGVVSFTAAGTEFTLEYKEGVAGPLLKAGDYYLVIEQGRVTGVKAESLNTDNAFTVYTGNTYVLYTDDTQDQQPYQFYNSTNKKLETLDHNSTPKLFTSSMATSAEVKVGNTAIASLTKTKDSDEFYTAHIVMRVWVEGTDREAKTPLADGIFDMSLHFTSQ